MTRAGECRQFKFLEMSHRITLDGLSRGRLARFSRRTEIDWLLISIKTADRAPRLKASMPNAPVPANRSSTVAPGTWKAIILNIASLVRSAVGLNLVPLTDRSLRPLSFPPMILNYISSAVCYSTRFAPLRLLGLKAGPFARRGL